MASVPVLVLIFAVAVAFVPGAGFGAQGGNGNNGNSEEAHAAAQGQNNGNPGNSEHAGGNGPQGKALGQAAGAAAGAVAVALGNTAKPQDGEPGNSGTQGKSGSTPDQSAGPKRDNGGTDKPGGTGGSNADRDNNNGCGNDSDRDDDSNGWCGKKPKPDKPKPPGKPPKTPPGPPGKPPRPHQPSATIALSCTVGGARISLVNAGVNTEHFEVLRNGVEVERVQVKGETTAVRSYTMASGETATWSVVVKKDTISLASLTNNCPAPGTPGGPSAAAAQSCTVGGQSGAVVRLRNSSEKTIQFKIKKDGALVALVSVASGGTATKTYDMREDEKASFEISASGMSTLTRSLTNNCVLGTQFTSGGGSTLPVTGERGPIHTAAGLLGLVLAAQLAVALRRRSGEARA